MGWGSWPGISGGWRGGRRRRGYNIGSGSGNGKHRWNMRRQNLVYLRLGDVPMMLLGWVLLLNDGGHGLVVGVLNSLKAAGNVLGQADISES